MHSGGDCSVAETVAQVMKYQSILLFKREINEDQRALLLPLVHTLQAAKVHG